MRKKLSMIAFIWFALLFFLNLQYEIIGSNDYIIFWLSIIALFIIVIYQIFYIRTLNKVVLLEIIIVYLFLHLVYQVGYLGLRGSDSYQDYNFLKRILKNHSFSFGQLVDGWPMIHILSSIICIITEIDPLIFAKYFPSFLSSIIVLPIYLLVCKIYKNQQVALLSCLIYGTIPQFMTFEGLFVRETFALFIMILFFYIIYINKKRKDSRFVLLFIPLVPVIVFSHHFTPLMFIILLSIYILANKTIPFIYKKNMQMVRNFTGKINIERIYLIIIIATITFWAYHAITILERFNLIFTEVIGPREYVVYADKIELGRPIATLRGNIIFLGFFFYNILFTSILIIKLIIQKNIQKIEELSFSAFLFFCFFYSFLSLYLLGSLLYPQRFLSFGWMFGIIPLVAIIINLKKDVYKKLFVILLASFMIYNVYNIDTEYYTENASLRGVVTTEKEYAIAERINVSSRYYGYKDVNILYGHYGYTGVNNAILDIHGKIGGDIFNMGDFYNSSQIAIINEEILLNNFEDLKKASYEDYIKTIEIVSYKNKQNVDKIYDLGSIYIIKS